MERKSFEDTVAGATEIIQKQLAKNKPTILKKITARIGQAFGRKKADKNISSIIGREYEKVGEIGAGGMGAVLSTIEVLIKREVAMKVMLKPDDGGALSRFLKEAVVTARLEHNNIPPIYDVGVDEENHPYFTMRWVKEGQSLDKIIDKLSAGDREYQKKFTVYKRFEICKSVFNALAYAHKKGIVHRDLKPGNVLVGDSGEVYVIDWGLVKILGGGKSFDSKIIQRFGLDAAQTVDGIVMGTAAYMAPEQAKGNNEAVDQRADIYALGGILYTVLSFQTANPVERFMDDQGRINYYKLLPAIEKGDLSLKGMVSIKDKELTRIIMKCLTRKPEDRYQSVPELIEDFDACREGRKMGLLKEVIEIFNRGGSYESVLSLINDAKETDPANHELYFLEGQLHMNFEKGDEAIGAFEEMNKVIKENSGKESTMALFYAGEAARRIKGETQKALELYRQCEKAGEEKGVDIHSLLSKAYVQLDSNEAEKAVKTLEDILKKDNKFAEAYELLGSIHSKVFDMVNAKGLSSFQTKIPGKLVDLGKAIGYFSKAIECSSGKKQGRYYGLRGWAFWEKGKMDQAKEDVEKAVELDNSLGTQLFRIKFYEANNNFRSILEITDYIIKFLKKEKPILLLNRGVAHEKLGHLDEAIADFEKALEMSKKSPDNIFVPADSFYSLGVAYRRKGNFQKALDYYKQTIEADPENFQAFNNAGDCFIEQGKFDLAIQCCRKSLKINPNYGLAYLTQGIAYFKCWEKDQESEDFKNARQCLTESLKRGLSENMGALANKELGRTYFISGKSYFENGEYARAIVDFEKSERHGVPDELASDLKTCKVNAIFNKPQE